MPNRRDTLQVVLYTHTFLPQIGGRELVVHQLALALQQLGVAVRVVGPTGLRRARHLVLPYPVQRWPTLLRSGIDPTSLRGRLRAWEMALQLRLELALRGADLIHAHTSWPNGWIASQLRYHTLRRVITPHGIDIHTIPQLQHGWRLQPRIASRIRSALQRADAVTAISDSIATAALAAGADPARLHRIDNGVDLTRFATVTLSHAQLCYHFGLPTDSRLLVSVGNYHQRKGFETLLRAMVPLCCAEPRLQLVLVGKGHEQLRPLLQHFALSQRVRLTGVLPPPLTAQADDRPDWLAALLQHAIGYVSAATEEGAEGLSLALLEALAAATPVVATAISGSRELIQPYRNGLLVAANESAALTSALLTLLRLSPSQHQQWRQQARATVHSHSWRRVASRYLALYQQLLAAPPVAGTTPTAAVR